MANKGKAVAIAAGGAAIAGFMFLTGKAKAAPEEKPKPKPKPKLLEPVALAVKYARLFGVPASLVVAVIDVQSNNRRDAINLKNARGGAWGYGQMTLLTAQDLVKRFPAIAAKYWRAFNGTGKSLLDPNVNISMTAYQLSLLWKRYRGKQSNWLVTALAYHQGAGNMDKLLASGGGKLPAKLPPNATIMKARFLNAQKKPVVAKLLAAERAGFSVTGVEADTGAGPQMTKTATNANIAASAEKFQTVDQARAALGAAAIVLKKAYPIADKAPFLAAWGGLRKALHSRIDQVNLYAQRVYKEVSAIQGTPNLTMRKKVALAVLQSNDVLADVDKAANDPELALLPDFLAAIKKILAGVGKAVQSVLPAWLLPAGIAVGAGALILTARK